MFSYFVLFLGCGYGSMFVHCPNNASEKILCPNYFSFGSGVGIFARRARAPSKVISRGLRRLLSALSTQAGETSRRAAHSSRVRFRRVRSARSFWALVMGGLFRFGFEEFLRLVNQVVQFPGSDSGVERFRCWLEVGDGLKEFDKVFVFHGVEG
jgi:hypothetical protein